MPPLPTSRVCFQWHRSVPSVLCSSAPAGRWTRAICSRSTKPSPWSAWLPCASSDGIRKGSTCTAAPARWVIRLAPRAPVFWSLCWVRCGPGSSAVASRPSASAGAKQPPWPSNCSTEEANMLLTDEQREIADMARQFAQQRLLPFAAEWDREHQFPAGALAEMGELGFLGMLVPEPWGGCDTGYLTYALALEEIAAGDGACSTIMSVHNSVGCAPILRFGSEEQKQRFLPPLASGRQIGAFALTEPH